MAVIAGRTAPQEASCRASPQEAGGPRPGAFVAQVVVPVRSEVRAQTQAGTGTRPVARIRSTARRGTGSKDKPDHTAALEGPPWMVRIAELDRKMDVALGQLQTCVAGLDEVKGRLAEATVSPRGHGGCKRPQPDVGWERPHSGIGAWPSREVSVEEVGNSSETSRKIAGAWLQPVAPDCADANLRESSHEGVRKASDKDPAWSGGGRPRPVDEDSEPSRAPTNTSVQDDLRLLCLKNGDTVRVSMTEPGDASPLPPALHRMLSAGKGALTEKVWNVMNNDDNSLEATWWARLWVCFLLLSVLFTLMQALESPLVPPVGAAAVETGIDMLFGLELVVRFLTAPDMKHFVTSPFIVVDVVSILPIVPRALVGFTLPQRLDSRDVPALLLVCVVPVLRLAKVLRWTGVQGRLFQRVLASTMETLQFLALCGSLMVLTFAFWIFLVEPRESVDTYWKAIWLTIVTMTTVGYGDVTPETTEGHVVISILIVCSVLFMAIPVGVLGNAFAFVWSERDLILLVDQTQRRLAQWGYTPSDLPEFFLRFDADGDGELSLDEFIQMMTALKVTLNSDRMIDLFEVFDRDHGGSIDDKEFMRAVFPKAFHECVQREKEEKEEKERQEAFLKKKAIRDEHQRRAWLEQGGVASGTLVATEEGETKRHGCRCCPPGPLPGRALTGILRRIPP
ncbi:unnamed protein product [Prorocentrum cordatum]|uniref:EF-hand domain-containing protein n=1 Tax=Prorocentrum cordatum TaxID=2364126 RepID=A0ABN9W3B0_9DINO|nr:unnamed protein product [Polarella glacialis]